MTARSSTGVRTSVAVAAVFTAAMCWGLNGAVTKVLYRDAHFDPIGLVAARGVWSLPIFIAMTYAAWPQRLPGAADWWRLIVLGLIYGPVTAWFIALGAQQTSGAHISLLISLAPPIVAVAGALIFRERLDRIRILALVIGIAGATLLASTRSATGSTVIGDIYVLVQVVGIAAATLITRSLARRFNAVFLSGVFGAIGMAALALMGIAGGGASTIVAVTANPATALWFFIVIVLGISVYTQIAQTYAMGVLGAGTTSLIGSYGSLIVGLVAAIVLLRESLTPAGIVAALLMASSLGLAIAPVKNASGSRP